MRQARQRQSQVCGVHGRGLSGFGQQVHLWPLSIPDPAVRLISPGRRVFRRVTRCHRPWPGCRAPTNPPSRRAAQPEPHCISTVRPGGGACRARSGCGRRPEGVTAGASSTTISPASPTTSNPSSCSRAGPTPGRGRGRRRSARSWPSADRRTGRGASHRGYPWFPIPTRQHPSMLRRCRGRTAGPLKELRRLRRGSSPTLGMQESV
jgi:hypothetical protein